MTEYSVLTQIYTRQELLIYPTDDFLESKRGECLGKIDAEGSFLARVGLWILSREFTLLDFWPEQDSTGIPLLTQGYIWTVSYSGDYILCGLVPIRHITYFAGDIEQHRPIALTSSTLHTTREYEIVQSSLGKESASEQRERAFFVLWTAKESIVKALGTGLDGLIDISLTSGERSDSHMLSYWNTPKGVFLVQTDILPSYTSSYAYYVSP